LYAIIRLANGALREGIILKRTANRMRILAPGMTETLELRRTGESWSTENGEKVEFHFLATASQLIRGAESRAAAGSSSYGPVI